MAPQCPLDLSPMVIANVNKLYTDTFLYYIYNTLVTLFSCVSGAVFTRHHQPEGVCTRVCVSCDSHVAFVLPCDSSGPAQC